MAKPQVECSRRPLAIVHWMLFKQTKKNNAMKNCTSAQAAESTPNGNDRLKRRQDDWNIFQSIIFLKGLNNEEKDREREEEGLGCFI